MRAAVNGRGMDAAMAPMVAQVLERMRSGGISP